LLAPGKRKKDAVKRQAVELEGGQILVKKTKGPGEEIGTVVSADNLKWEEEKKR